MTKYMGHELHYCRVYAGIIEHGINASSPPQIACHYWQIRLFGKLVDTALTLEAAQNRIGLRWEAARILADKMAFG